MGVRETVAEVRAKYGPSPDDRELGLILNEAAWKHRAEGWGLSRKNSGAKALHVDGSFIARDILHHRPSNMIYDVLVAAGDGGPATPAWQEVGVMTDPARPWVAPLPPPSTFPKPSEIKIAVPMSNGATLTWPITCDILEIETAGDEIKFPYSKAGQFPVEDPFGDGTKADGCLWAVCKVGDEWVAGTIDWLRPGQIKKTRPANEYGLVWKAGYDNYTGPKSGELIGYFVSTLARMGKTSRVNERSAIIWTKFQSNEIVGYEEHGDVEDPEDPPVPTECKFKPVDEAVLSRAIVEALLALLLPAVEAIGPVVGQTVDAKLKDFGAPIEFKIFGKTVRGWIGKKP